MIKILRFLAKGPRPSSFIPAYVQRHHFLVEHVHQSAGRGDDHVDAFTPDDIRLLLGRHPADGQNGPQLRVAVVLQLIADQVDIFARLFRQFSKWRETKATGQHFLTLTLCRSTDILYLSDRIFVTVRYGAINLKFVPIDHVFHFCHF